jgi:iron complex outermembrane receptor protein
VRKVGRRKPEYSSGESKQRFSRGKAEEETMRSGKFSWVFLLSLLLLNGADSVYGAGTAAGSEAISLPEVVVTATRDTEEVRRVPANVSVITAQQIEESGATTVVEVLERLESIKVVDLMGTDSKKYIDMRGFGGDNPYGKTLIMLNGKRLNRPDMSAVNLLQVPLNNIERIEVVRGAGTVLYGDSAIGGVINIITKKGEGRPQFNASIIAGSYGLHNERVGVSGSADKWSYSLTGDNHFNSGYRERSELKSQGGGLDIGYKASDLLNLSLGVSFTRTDYEMPGALTKVQMEQDRRQAVNRYDEASDKFTDVNFSVQSFLGSWGEFEVSFLYGRKDLESDMTSWFSYSDTMIDTYGITPKFIIEKDVFGFGNKLITGLDYYKESYDKDFFTSAERTTRKSWAELSRDSIGWYIRDEFSILKNVILHAGYRSERAEIDGDNRDQFLPAKSFSGKEKKYSLDAYETGATWLIGKTSKVFAKYGTFYRIPFLEEIAYFNGWGTGFLTDIEEDKGASTEIGMEFSPLKNLNLGFTLFRIDMKNEMVWNDTLYKNENTGKTRHDGAEVSFSYLFEKRAKLDANFTYHKATFENGADNKKEMPMVPNRMANVGADIYLPFNLTLRPEVRYVGEAFLGGDKDNSTEKLDSYTIVNLSLFYRASLKKVKTTAFFGVDNLTDQKYSSFGSDGLGWNPNAYYPMPGIVFKGGLSFEF